MDHLIDDNDRLKPCPFCGGKATFDHDDNEWSWIECCACGASTNARVSAMDDCKPLLLEQWNNRVPSEVQPPAQKENEMEAQKLHYENISGLLIRRDGALSWRCPLCKTEGQSSEVMRCCPECGSEEATIPGAHPAPSFADAYQGAMEDVVIWKKRALEAEDLNRKFVAEINGPAYMGEPAQPAPSVPDVLKITRDFTWVSEKQHHIPTLILEFTPVPANSPNDGKGWKDRDNLAAMLAAAPKPEETK